MKKRLQAKHLTHGSFFEKSLSWSNRRPLLAMEWCFWMSRKAADQKLVWSSAYECKFYAHLSTPGLITQFKIYFQAQGLMRHLAHGSCDTGDSTKRSPGRALHEGFVQHAILQDWCCNLFILSSLYKESQIQIWHKYVYYKNGMMPDRGEFQHKQQKYEGINQPHTC